MVRLDLECRIEGAARSNDTKILIENNERFSDRVDDGICKHPGVLDVGELLLEHAETLVGARSLPNSQSPPRPTAAEDTATIHLLRAVGDINSVRRYFDGAAPIVPGGEPKPF
jgi:hypothetical protein